MTLWLRLMLLLLLSVAWWNPGIPWGKSAVNFFLLIDDSLSMKNKVDQNVWEQIQHKINNLPEGSRLAVIRYAEYPVLETELTEINDIKIRTLLDSAVLTKPVLTKPVLLKHRSSNLEKALLFTARLIKPERSSTVAIVHNDQKMSENAAAVINSLNKQGIQLIQLNVSKSPTEADAWITSLNAPLYADGHQQIPVSVLLGSNREMSGKLSLLMNGHTKQQKTVQLSPDHYTTVQFVADTCEQDSCIISVELEPEHDAITQNNERQLAVTVNSAKSVLYIHNTTRNTAVLTSLLSMDYRLNAIHPDLCIPSAEELQAYHLIILDDIAINDLSTDCWTALDKSVRDKGIGLLVLGGDNSFSAGSYRHSLLETLLPVTSEAANQKLATTLLFLVDKSGSMDSDSSGNSRIAMARLAMLESLQAQNQHDSFGLISFDVAPHLNIPIQHYSDPILTIKQGFNMQAMGGTRLKPALDFALQELSKVHAEKRILLLLTDGFLDEQDALAVEKKISAEKIDLITLAIGNDIKSQGLQHLAKLGNGKLLQVNKIAELPLLMRKEIDQRRTPIETGKITVNQMQALPFMKNNAVWPDLSAYRVTKAKPDSTVYLSSPGNDPLLAMHYVGMGKVVALPAGLGNWANAWTSWKEWDYFFKGLLDWSAVNNQHKLLDVTLRQNADYVIFEVDTLTSNLDGNNIHSGEMVVNDPNGQIHTQELKIIAPGRYRGHISANIKGLYKIAIRLGELSTTLNFFNNVIEEYIPATGANELESKFQIENTVKNWETDRVINQQIISIREPLLCIIFYLYLLYIATLTTTLFRNIKLNSLWLLIINRATLRL